MLFDFVDKFIFADLKERVAGSIRVILILSAFLYFVYIILTKDHHEYTMATALVAACVLGLSLMSFVVKQPRRMMFLISSALGLVIVFILLSFGITIPLFTLILVINLFLLSIDRRVQILFLIFLSLILLLEVDIFELPLPIFRDYVPKLDIINTVLYVIFLYLLSYVINVINILYKNDDLLRRMKIVDSFHNLRKSIKNSLMIDGLNYRLSLHSLKNILLSTNVDFNTNKFLNLIFFTTESLDNVDITMPLIKIIHTIISYVQRKYLDVPFSVDITKSILENEIKLNTFEANIFISVFFNILKNAATFVNNHGYNVPKNLRTVRVEIRSYRNGNIFQVEVNIRNSTFNKKVKLENVISTSVNRMSGLYLSKLILRDTRKGSLNFSIMDNQFVTTFIFRIQFKQNG